MGNRSVVLLAAAEVAVMAEVAVASQQASATSGAAVTGGRTALFVASAAPIPSPDGQWRRDVY
jgi:hypothetical protein